MIWPQRHLSLLTPLFTIDTFKCMGALRLRVTESPTMSDHNTPAADAPADENSVHVPTIDEMSDAEFWQRIALEATANDDPGKALAMRVESFFEHSWAFPRQKDACAVHGAISVRGVHEWLMSTDFEAESVESNGAGNVVVKGISYEPEWLDDFDG